MKYQIKFVCFLFVLMAFIPSSNAAEDELPDNIHLGNASTATTLGDGGTMSNTEIMKLVEKSLNEASAANAVASGITVLSGEDAEDENKVFRYDSKKSVFDGAILPQRTFNNIPYPY